MGLRLATWNINSVRLRIDLLRRLVEAVVFGLVMSAFCIGLFRFALGLPVPVAPWLIGY